MCQVGKIGMTAQKGKQRVEEGRIFLVSEQSEEEDGGTYGIKNACRAELMRTIDALQQGRAGIDELVVVAQQREEGDPEKNTDPHAIFLHECMELIYMHGQPSAEKEDEDVMEHPIIQAIGKEGFEEGIVGEIGDIVIEGRAETGNIVERNLEQEQQSKAPQIHTAYHGNPYGHEKIEPQEDDQEIEVIVGDAEEEEPAKFRRARERGGVEDVVYREIEKRPEQVGNQHRAEAALQEIFVVESFVDVEVVEKAKGRDKEKDRDTETCEYFEKRDEMEIGRRV